MASSDGRLAGKRALITGAGTGIGEAIAHKFAREGARVFLAGLPEDPLDEVAEALREKGAEAEVYEGDLGEEDHARACVEAAAEAFGGLDVLVNDAGVFPDTGETQEYPVDAFDRMLHSNVRTTFLMTRYALPHLQESHGNVIGLGSEAGQLGIADNTPYGGTKGWVHAFIKGVAVEQAKHGVRANCICPGAVDTAWTRKETGPMDEDMEDTMTGATPLGRRGTPEEIANVAAFVASDEASYVSGTLYFVDGALTVSKGTVGEQVPEALRQQPEGTLGLEHAHEGLESPEPK